MVDLDLRHWGFDCLGHFEGTCCWVLGHEWFILLVVSSHEEMALAKLFAVVHTFFLCLGNLAK